MAKIVTVAKARQTGGACEKCGTAIAVGDGYKHISPRAYPGAYSKRRVRCLACPPWKAWETTTSKNAPIMELIDTYEKELGSVLPEDTDRMLSDWAATVHEVADGWQESHDNMPDNLQQSERAQEYEEKANALADWADEIESVMIPDTDSGDYEQEVCGACDGDGYVECARCQGTGLHNDGDGADDEKESCHDCDGKATVECLTCDGNGTLDDLTDQGVEEWRDAFADSVRDVVENCPVDL